MDCPAQVTIDTLWNKVWISRAFHGLLTLCLAKYVDYHDNLLKVHEVAKYS